MSVVVVAGNFAEPACPVEIDGTGPWRVGEHNDLAHASLPGTGHEFLYDTPSEALPSKAGVYRHPHDSAPVPSLGSKDPGSDETSVVLGDHHNLTLSQIRRLDVEEIWVEGGVERFAPTLRKTGQHQSMECVLVPGLEVTNHDGEVSTVAGRTASDLSATMRLG